MNLSFDAQMGFHSGMKKHERREGTRKARTRLKSYLVANRERSVRVIIVRLTKTYILKVA